MNSESPCKKYDHTSQRREKTFTAFRDNTDEKNQTFKITKEFLGGYLPPLIHNLTITVQDWGVGDGHLSGKIAVLMQNYTNNSNISVKEIKYEGIDRSIQFVQNTTNRLFSLGIKNNNIVLGNIFGGGIDKLSKNPTLLIASHVLYYTKDIKKFVENITKQMGFIAIVIGQASGSFVDYTGIVYDNTTGKSTGADKKMDAALDEQNKFNSIKIIYNSVLDFPKNVSFEELKKISTSNFDDLEGRDAHIRYLLEFTGGSMERLICEGSLENFLQDVQTQLNNTGGNINCWNFISIIVPEDKLSIEELTGKLREMEKLILSGNITSFESAIKEGNYEIIYTLFNQGLVTCRLRDYKYNLQKDIIDSLFAFFLYELRLSHGYQTVANLFNYELDPHANFRNYTHPAIHRMKSIKYNFNMAFEDKITKEPDSISSPGRKYSESFDNQWFHNQYICTALLIIPPIIIDDRTTRTLLSLSMTLMYYNLYQRFIFTSENAVNAIDGEALLFQLFLFEEENIGSLKPQDSMGRTSLHHAIIANDTSKAYKLLCCDLALVNDLIRTKDINGKLPIHYASELNNMEIVEILLKKDISSNEESFNFMRSIFDGIFLISKLGYLYGYFTGWVVNNNLYPAVVLWPTYYFLKQNNIRFPENIYFHSFLLRLNPFGREESYLNKSSESYERYNRDNALHFASRNNHTKLVNFLVERNETFINNLNANGESILHLAVDNNNLELIIFLIEHQAQINNRDTSWPIYPFADFTLKSILLCLSSDNILRILSDSLFLNSVYGELFTAFVRTKGTTPLHSAALSKHTSNETLEILINNGADPDLTMAFYDNSNIQIIPYVITKIIIFIASFYNTKTPITYKLLLLGASQILVPYNLENLKPINLVKDKSTNEAQCINKDSNKIYELLKQYGVLNFDKSIDQFNMIESSLYRLGVIPLDSGNKKNSELYQYLKKYTIFHDYKTITEFSPFELMLYKLGLISDDDTIHIKEPGAYKGGSGSDTFIIDGNMSTGQIIIKDYSPPEDRIIFNNCNIEEFKYRTEEVLNIESTIAYIDNELELILIGVEQNELNFS